MQVLICGAGLMGQAIAFDLIHHSTIKNITMIDANPTHLKQTQQQLNHENMKYVHGDITNKTWLKQHFKAADISISAVPYCYNYSLAKLAIHTHTHFIDLGGNTDIVKQEQTLHAQAKKNKQLIIPDCGLAPGLVSIITRDIVNHFDATHAVHLKVGGVPQHPKPPFHYQQVFSIDGLINEYAEPSLILDHGRIIKKPSLTELETIYFPKPFNEMEAFLTAGGCSTLPYSFKNQIGYLDYKTIRYPGHCNKIKPFFKLGMASTTPINIQGLNITPRIFLKHFLQTNIPVHGDDVVLLNAVGTGIQNNQKSRRHYQIIEYCDKKNHLSAMMKMTGFPVAITADMIHTNIIDKPGVFCPEEIIPPTTMFAELSKRGITLNINMTKDFHDAKNNGM